MPKRDARIRAMDPVHGKTHCCCRQSSEGRNILIFLKLSEEGTFYQKRYYGGLGALGIASSGIRKVFTLRLTETHYTKRKDQVKCAGHTMQKAMQLFLFDCRTSSLLSLKGTYQ